jgi:signal transduction histidine kinase
MGAFAWGVLAGMMASLLLAAGAGMIAYRRLVGLERRARQAERMAELGLLTGGLAHEIKNPLSTVQLNLQLLQEDLPADHPSFNRMASRLQTVQREAGRLRAILDDFLRYAGNIELDRQVTDLNELLEELADFVSPQAQLHRVQLRVRRSEAPAPAAIDARLIKQALLNLALNAMQAMSPAGGELILCLEMSPLEARIDVIDTGPGIAREHLDKIFLAYYSTKRGGTGLGLPMTRRIVEAHGGRLDVCSEPGKGSQFTIRLPLQA